MARITIDLTYHRVLLGTAEAQVDDAQYPIAIVTAQMALEVRIELAMANLLSAYDGLPVEALVGVLPDRTMMQRSMRGLWDALTEDSIKRAPTWKEYQRHVERRNRLAHGSEAWSSREDAEASVAAVRGLIEHIDAVEHRVLAGRQPGPGSDTA